MRKPALGGGKEGCGNVNISFCFGDRILDCGFLDLRDIPTLPTYLCKTQQIYTWTGYIYLPT